MPAFSKMPIPGAQRKVFQQFVRRLSIVAIAVLMTPADSMVFAQTTAAAPAQEEQLERDFTNPLTTMPQIVVRDSYTPANYGP